MCFIICRKSIHLCFYSVLPPGLQGCLRLEATNTDTSFQFVTGPEICKWVRTTDDHLTIWYQLSSHVCFWAKTCVQTFQLKSQTFNNKKSIQDLYVFFINIVGCRTAHKPPKQRFFFSPGVDGVQSILVSKNKSFCLTRYFIMYV